MTPRDTDLVNLVTTLPKQLTRCGHATTTLSVTPPFRGVTRWIGGKMAKREAGRIDLFRTLPRSGALK